MHVRDLEYPNLGPVAAIFCIVIASLFAACDPVPDIRAIDWGDLSPPSLIEQTIETDGTITLDFDEAISIVSDTLRLEPGLDLTREPYHPDPADSSKIALSIGGNAIPGAPYTFELSVSDGAGNDIFVVLPFYGPNPHPARLLINEVLTKSSTNNRDAVELYVSEGGNLGGIAFTVGTVRNYDHRLIFPAREVETGDYIIVHCKPEGSPDEIDEAVSKTASGGKNSSPSAWDFWVKDSSGLPDTTGIVSVAKTAMGPYIDAVFYTDKITEEGKDYRSFGTRKMMERADELASVGAWIKSSGNIRTEDGARSTGLTATRSLSRSVSRGDSNSLADWHVVPSGGLTLGGSNTDEVYVAASRR